MKNFAFVLVMLTGLLQPGFAFAYARGGGGGRAPGGARAAPAVHSAPAPHYSGAGATRPAGGGHPGFVGGGNTAVNKPQTSINKPTNNGRIDLGGHQGNTNVANRGPTTNVGNRGPTTNVGDRTRVGNSGTQIGNRGTQVNDRTRVGGTTIGSGNTTINRPQVGNTNVGNRVGNTNVGNRTQIGGNNTNIVNRGGVGNRDTNIVNRGGIGDRTNVNTGNITGRQTTVVNNQTTNVNNRKNVTVNAPGAGSTVVNAGGYRGGYGYGAGNVGYNRAWGYNRPWSGSYGWYRGSWGGWGAYPTVWGGLSAASYGAGLATGAALSTPTVVYSNPYYVPVPVPVATPGSPTIVQSSTYVVPPELDYSRPINVPTEQQAQKTDADVTKAAQQRLDVARTAFRKGDYETALKEDEQAIHILPGDANLHEFRSLCLFAQGKYKDAAGSIYAVLSAGPGWDWGSLSSFYPDANTYTKQLRGLESFVKDNPKVPEGHFLLAYHYLVLDERAAALDQLHDTMKLQPKDKLSASLAEALEKDQKK